MGRHAPGWAISSQPISVVKKSSFAGWLGITAFSTALSFIIVFSAVSDAKEYSLLSRDIGCEEVDLGRTRQICKALSASLTWQWMGHATVDPGYKPSFEATRELYCNLKIEKNDEEALLRLKNYDPTRHWLPDWRLESGANMLLLILINLDGSGDEPINSMFNPKSANYILKNGCR